MIKICSGNVEIWDQTVGCPECQKELWNYPGIRSDMSIEQYEEIFFLEHPFMFDAAHDDGDCDPDSEERLDIAWYYRITFGNALERWPEWLLTEIRNKQQNG